MNGWYKRIHTSEQLKGQTGDNGETFCAFFICAINPLSSVWAWFHTKEEAEAFTLKEA